MVGITLLLLCMQADYISKLIFCRPLSKMFEDCQLTYGLFTAQQRRSDSRLDGDPKFLSFPTVPD